MSPRRVASFFALAGALFVSALLSPAAGTLVYFGTFTQGTSEGIYVSRFDTDTGTLGPAELAARTTNPVFIAFGPAQRILYAIGERPTADGRPGGTIEAFSVHADTGKLTFLDHAPAGGGPLCYVQVDKSGRTLLSASYRDGYVVSFPLHGNGAPGQPAPLIAHAGSSVHDRQKGPHAHCIDLDPANRFALVADLGLDRVYAYRFDPATGVLAPMPNPFRTKPGAGPRHLTFDARGDHVYLVNEIDNTLLVASYDAQTAAMTEIQLLPLLPPDFKEENTASEVVLHPSGRFLYVSNRGHDSLALFNVAPATGLLTFVEYMREGIKHPRHFAIDPTGRWLVCGNRDAATATVYRIDTKSGRLAPTGKSVEVPMPSCVQFFGH